VSDVLVWIGVGLLGGLGAVARLVVGDTLVVNVSGSLLLGVLAGLTLSDDALLLAATALLGSYTTFSAWMLETHRAPGRAHAAANVAGSLALGVAAVALGRWIA
jgi:CrcB protein